MPSTATFHFSGSLNDFLPRQQRGQPISHPFDWRASIKDMIESLGVPHPEIEALRVNGVAVSFDYTVQPGDVIHAYPVFESPPLPDALPLRPPLELPPRFILDQHLGRLAAYLRMMGFDTRYRNDYHDEELAQVSHAERRVLLTRDVGLLKRNLVIDGYFVRATHREQQVMEIAGRYSLRPHIRPFRHCMTCNGLVDAVPKESIRDRLPTETARYYDEFYRCGGCGQLYWKGPHYQRMQDLLNRLQGE
jgi:uncharacterized protein with PIN domain